MPKSQLVELYAEHIGVIVHARVNFGSQFNVITGETGAGKTLLLGALDLSLGAEGSVARFAVTSQSKAVAVFTTDATEHVFARETTTGGRLRSTLDGIPTSAEALRESAKERIVIHGQHDSLSLRSKTEVVRLLDKCGRIDTSTLESLRTRLREALRERDTFGGDASARLRELEFLDFQASEIEAASIVDDRELHDALEELTMLSDLVSSLSAMSAVAEALDGDDDDAVLTRFSTVLRSMPDVEQVRSVQSELQGSLEAARDAVRTLRQKIDPDAVNGERMHELDARVGVLQGLIRKYGPTLADVMAHGVSQREAHTQMVAALDRLNGIDQEISSLQEAEQQESRRIRRERDFAATTLTNAVRQQLTRVALPNASLRFVVDGIDGSDATVLFTPNPGQLEGPLQALASGGELSRVLLAISLVADDEGLVAVFDEVDAGIGGEVAQQIGACLSELGQRQQVIAVTHLASVAARANHHFVIEKAVLDGVTRTSVREVTGSERLREVARMLAGDQITTESLALAERLVTSTQ